jgi:hypothetical protein
MLRIILGLTFLLTASFSAHAEARPEFADYPTDIVAVETLAAPTFLLGGWIADYRADIEACVADTGINFGSHFTVCGVSRGPDSQTIFVVDRVTGFVQALTETRAGFETQAGSLLFLANTDHDAILQYVEEDSIPESYVTKFFFFNEKQMSLEGLEE